MKKLLAILLSLMIFACGFGAAAESEPVTEELPVSGLTFTVPQAFADAKGMIGCDGSVQLDTSVIVTYWYYVAATVDEYTEWLTGSAELPENRIGILFYVFSVGDRKSFADICPSVSSQTGIDFDAENAMQIGQAEDWTFWLVPERTEDFVAGMDPAYAEETAVLCGLREELASAFTCSVPFIESGEMDGRIVRFEATDLEGNPVSSEEIFAQHAVTMVNIWATWCGPCVGELAELQAIHTRFEENDCAILGLMIDDDTASAQSLIEANGITYQIVIAPQNFSSIFPYEAVPTSFYVDRNGAFLGSKIVGADTELYESALTPLLEQVQQSAP